jgi:glycosyltransferase involved in cell wall biosynthesis
MTPIAEMPTLSLPEGAGVQIRHLRTGAVLSGKDKMRVLHVIPSIAPRYGGPSQAILEMCRALQDQGIQLLIATTDADGDSRLPVVVGSPVDYHGVPAIFFTRQCSEAYKYSYPLARWLGENVKTFSVVHIHAVFSHASLAAARICRRHRIPYVVRPLGTLDPWSMRRKRLRKRFLWRLGVERMLRHAAAIHYTTAEERRLAEDSLRVARGVVIPHGIETEHLQIRDDSGLFRQRNPALDRAPYVLVLSRLHPKKGLELLLEAFLDLVRQPQFEQWKLVIAGAGDGRYVTSLRRQVQQSGGNEHVLFSGWLADREKISALQNAALLALPSYQENFGLCIAEALACGVPVLVSRQVNLAREIEAAGAGWIAAMEPDDLREKLARALQMEKERARRGEAGRAFVDRALTWSSVTAQLITLYRSIIEGTFGQPRIPNALSSL